MTRTPDTASAPGVSSTEGGTGAPAGPPRYQGRPAIAAKRGISANHLAHRMRRHPDGIPEPDAYEELGNGEIAPLWLPGRDTDWEAWEATFPGRTGRPRKEG
jgi:hypothetical protein